MADPVEGLQDQAIVTLVGLRGAGKTTVGTLLAQCMGAEFQDLDLELARRFAAAGESTGELLSRVGEESFREFEAQALAACLEHPGPLVLATGGGALLRPANRASLTEHSYCVWLQADPGELSRRIAAEDLAGGASGGSTRPSLTGLEPAEEMKRLARERAAHYAAVADLACETEGRAPEIIAAEIFSKLPR